MGDAPGDTNFIGLTAEIVSAYVGNNIVAPGDIPALINQVHSALLRVSSGQAESLADPPKPAVPVNVTVPGGSKVRFINDDSREHEPSSDPPKPVVSVKKSITPDHIFCLEDGKKFKSLKRHLRTQYDMTPEQYREKWGLAADYPMVAPNYAAARSQLAKQMGLGQQRRRRR